MSPALMLATGLILPGGVAAVAFLALCRLFANTDAASRNGALGGVAIGLGYIAGHLAIAWPAFPPIEATDRVVWLAGASVCVAGVSAAVRGRGWCEWISRILLSAMTVGALVGPIYESIRETWMGPAWAAVLGVLLAASWANLEALAERVPRTTIGVPVVVMTLGAAVALTVSGSVVLGRFCAATAASFMALLALMRSGSCRVALGSVFGPVVGALLILGYVYSSLPASAGMLLASSPLVLWAARIPALARRPTWQQALVVTLLAIVPTATAILLSFSDSSGY